MMRLLTVCSLLLLLAIPAAAYRVTDISVVPSGDVTLVTLTADDAISYERFLLTDPMRIVLDIGDAVHSLPSMDFSVNRGGILSIRTSQYKAPPEGIVRIIIDVSGELLNYSATLDGNQLVLEMQTDPTGIPFAPWSATSEYVQPVLTGDVAPLSSPDYSTLSGQSIATSTRGIRISEVNRQIEDGFPVEWSGTGGRRITIDVVDASIRTVMRAISDVSGINIMLPEDYTASVTARLQNVGWRDALTAILNSQGLVASMQGNVLRVLLRDEFYTEINQMASTRHDRENLQELQTEIYVIRYATAQSLNSALSTALSDRGQISIDDRTNSLIITDIPYKLEEVGRLLPILDSPTAQVMIEAKLVEIDASYANEMGIDWSLGNLSRTNELVHGGAASTGLAVGDPTGSFSFGTITSMFDVNAVLTLLESQNHAHILSEPRIAIIDNMTGTVMSGKEIPLTLLDPSGNIYIQMYSVGVELTVTPHINADNNVTLELYPVVSELSAEATSSNQPIILTQSANTTLMIDDGATAVIGGIMRSKQTTVRRAIPILGSIPLLGDLLFSYNSEREESTELVIFVTPHIIRPY
ncbi:MAG: AMIN domain-containing protein [Candidatus Aegiribacteria sp.]|nr:AMIN domain-containing protein [Candidatus Aegiribacteria sp.]